MVAFEHLAEAPARGRHVVRRQRPAVAGGDGERQALAVQLPVALPVLAPVPAHGHPPRLRALDRHRRHVAGAAHVGDEHQVEVGVAIDGEADAALLGAGHTAVEHRHDAAAVDPDLLERRLSHVEVLPRRVAPAAGVAGLGGVGRAEIGGGDHDAAAAANTPLGVGGHVALDLEAGAAAEAGVEERGAEGGGVGAVAGGVEVAVAAGTAHGARRIPAAIEGGVGGGPAAAAQGFGGSSSSRRGHEENGGGAHGDGHGHEEEHEIVG